MNAHNWLLLTYKVPPEDHIRWLKIIENEINEMAGESILLETVALERAQKDKVIARFKADRNEEYKEFLGKCADFEAEIAHKTEVQHFTYAELEENDVDLKKLRFWLEKIAKRDFYEATLAGRGHRMPQGLRGLAGRIRSVRF